MTGTAPSACGGWGALAHTGMADTDRQIIRLRYGLGGTVPLTQREIASTFGISRSYVSRIEKRALEKLRAELEKPVGSGAGQ